MDEIGSRAQARSRAVLQSAGPVRYVGLTCVLMVGLYALAYGPHSEGSVVARWLQSYLEVIARLSWQVLRLLGETVQIRGATVSGRFAYVVVLDCAALDAQALFVAAVLAFPATWWARLVGVVTGVLVILAINVARLAGLYFAGAHSRELFHVLHEEVLVFVIVACVCMLFLLWANWARRGLPHATPVAAGA
jgi:exosortase/archaeosortase family protein